MPLYADIPPFQAYVEEKTFYQGDPTRTGWVPVVMIGVESREGQPLAFVSLDERGVLVEPIYVHQFAMAPDAAPTQLDRLEAWNCLSSDVEISVMGYLAGNTATVYLAGEPWTAVYRWTARWKDSATADGLGPLGRKPAHFFEVPQLKRFALLPNYYVCPWNDKAWVTNPWPLGEKPDYKVITAIPSAERKPSPHSNEMMYGVAPT